MPNRSSRKPLPHACFDRILPRELFRDQPTRPTPGLGGGQRAIAIKHKPWISGSTLRVRFLGGSPDEQANARKQAGWWQAVANLNFVFDDAPDAEIRIAFDPQGGAWSYIGTDAKTIPKDQPTMNLGFEDGGTAAHEFGHAIGLAHEHQNPDGGIEWNEPVVLKAMAGYPNYWSEQETRHNIFRRYSADEIIGTKFDPDSVMLYFFPAEWTITGIGTKANPTLSAADKAFVAGERMYPGRGQSAVEPTPLKVNARSRVAGSIGTFGEEDVYIFDADQEGGYVVDTRGSTDVVMKLFGPDQPTALIAEDDDSGLGSNARIAARLTRGRYWVQVRHYNREAAVGDYSIAVKRTNR